MNWEDTYWWPNKFETLIPSLCGYNDTYNFKCGTVTISEDGAKAAAKVTDRINENSTEKLSFFTNIDVIMPRYIWQEFSDNCAKTNEICTKM